MNETCVVIGADNNALYWHNVAASNIKIPDSRELWNFLWENKDVITGVAHTHPGFGRPHPSTTDITTFIAVENGLGKHLNWFIISQDSQTLCLFDHERGDLPSGIISVELDIEHITKMTWIYKLRELSNY
jgi:hypothetical protein